MRGYIRCEIFPKELEKLHSSLRAMELVWLSGSVMDCHGAQGSIPDGVGEKKNEHHVLRKGQ